MIQLTIEPSRYASFISPLSGSLSDKGITLQTGAFIQKWEGTSDVVVVMSAFEGGIDTGMRLKLHKPLPYAELCKQLGVRAGLWIDMAGNVRELRPYDGLLKRVFAPKVAA
jgi:hypothetical protein